MLVSLLSTLKFRLIREGSAPKWVTYLALILGLVATIAAVIAIFPEPRAAAGPTPAVTVAPTTPTPSATLPPTPSSTPPLSLIATPITSSPSEPPADSRSP